MVIDGIKVEFVDAYEMAVNHPDTFEIPTVQEIRKLDEGDFAKLGFKANDGKQEVTERMWVKITEKESNTEFKGTLSNTPFILGFLSFGDEFTFKANNIYSVKYEKK